MQEHGNEQQAVNTRIENHSILFVRAFAIPIFDKRVRCQQAATSLLAIAEPSPMKWRWKHKKW